MQGVAPGSPGVPAAAGAADRSGGRLLPVPRHRALYNTDTLMLLLCIAKFVCDKGAARFTAALRDLERASLCRDGASRGRSLLRAAARSLAFLSPQTAAKPAPGPHGLLGLRSSPAPAATRMLSIAHRLGLSRGSTHLPSGAGSLTADILSVLPDQDGVRLQLDGPADGLQGRVRRGSQLALDLLDSLPTQLQGRRPDQRVSLLLQGSGSIVPPADASDQAFGLQQRYGRSRCSPVFGSSSVPVCSEALLDCPSLAEIDA